MMNNKYKKNFKGHKWTETRKLTNEFTKKFKKDSALNGHNAWKSVADPNGQYRSIRNRIVLHNQKVRKAWQGAIFNEREKVLEGFADYKSNTLSIKHVDNEHCVKEKIFATESSDYSHLYNEDTEVRIFGNSELAINKLDRFEFGGSFIDFCNYIDTIISSVS